MSINQPLFADAVKVLESAFEPDTGGLGLALTASPTASAPQQLPLGHGRAFIVSNDSGSWFWLQFGGASVQATLGGLPIPPGLQLSFTFPNDPTLTYVSVITRAGGAATGTINFGKGL